jgi:hypothetical protein
MMYRQIQLGQIQQMRHRQMTLQLQNYDSHQLHHHLIQYLCHNHRQHLRQQ